MKRVSIRRRRGTRESKPAFVTTKCRLQRRSRRRSGGEHSAQIDAHLKKMNDIIEKLNRISVYGTPLYIFLRKITNARETYYQDRSPIPNVALPLRAQIEQKEINRQWKMQERMHPPSNRTWSSMIDRSHQIPGHRAATERSNLLPPRPGFT